MSVNSKSDTTSQADSLKISETTAVEDKGHNRSVIDWIEAHNPAKVFVKSEEGVLTFGDIARAATEGRSDELEVLTPALDLSSVERIFRAVSGGGALFLGEGVDPPESRPSGAAATVVPTSGTTGVPKFARLTLANWRAASMASARHLGHEPDDEWLLAMPLHHVGGLSILFRSAFAGSAVRIQKGFDAENFSRALRDGVTIVSVVATMLQRILDLGEEPYSGLKAVLVGGGPIPPGLLERASAAGLPVVPSYGMTETCGQVATLRPGSPLEYKAHLLPGVEARTTDEGRLQLRGPMVSPGYLGEPDRDPGEWFTTGDLVEIDEDRALRILARADEMIVSGGENVPPSRVEAALADHPGVRQVIVVGLPSDEWGTEIGCLYTGSVEVGVLAKWAKESLPGFMVPKRWHRTEVLPITELGKPDRSVAARILRTRVSR